MFIGCGGGKTDEKLTEEEVSYIDLTLALAKAKAIARDSIHHHHLRDSLFRAYQTTKDAYTARTEAYADKPERTSIIFRAIGDSLKPQ